MTEHGEPGSIRLFEPWHELRRVLQASGKVGGLRYQAGINFHQLIPAELRPGRHLGRMACDETPATTQLPDETAREVWESEGGAIFA